MFWHALLVTGRLLTDIYDMHIGNGGSKTDWIRLQKMITIYSYMSTSPFHFKRLVYHYQLYWHMQKISLVSYFFQNQSVHLEFLFAPLKLARKWGIIWWIDTIILLCPGDFLPHKGCIWFEKDNRKRGSGSLRCTLFNLYWVNEHSPLKIIDRIYLNLPSTNPWEMGWCTAVTFVWKVNFELLKSLKSSNIFSQILQIINLCPHWSTLWCYWFGYFNFNFIH